MHKLNISCIPKHEHNQFAIFIFIYYDVPVKCTIINRMNKHNILDHSEKEVKFELVGK